MNIEDKSVIAALIQRASGGVSDEDLLQQPFDVRLLFQLHLEREDRPIALDDLQRALQQIHLGALDVKVAKREPLARPRSFEEVVERVDGEASRVP